MKILLSWILLLVIILSGQAQEKTDSAFADQLNRIAFKLYLSKPDSAIALANHALSISVKNKIKYEVGFSYLMLSKANWAKVNYQLSTQYGFKALKTFESSSYTYELTTSMLALARTFNDLHNFTMAREFMNRAQSIAIDQANEELFADCNRELSLLFTNLHQYDSALYCADAGISTYKKLQDTLNMSILLGRKARIYFNQKDYKKSLFFNRKSLLLDSLVGNRRALGISYIIYAENLYTLHKTDSAVLLFKKSIPILHEVGNINSLIKAHEILAKIYAQGKQPLLAIQALQTASALKDTLYNLEKNGRVEEMRTLYELENKDKTIALLEKENMLEKRLTRSQRSFGLFLLIFIALLAVVIALLWRLRVIQTKANKTLATKNASIEYQKEEIEAQAENLQQLNKLKTKLFSVIGHDLRGPLTNLRALLELLTNNLMTPEEFISISGKLKAHLSISQRTLENLLHWSLSQMEGMRTEFQHVAIKTLIDEACRLMDEIALQKNINIQIEASESIIVVADPNQIQLVFRNLIHNAIKFSKPGDRILIETFLEQKQCVISVKDFGMGITEKEIARLTASVDHFTKAGTQQEKGTGLGLLLCKEFISVHHGDLIIESQPGKFTKFSFTLPLALV